MRKQRPYIGLLYKDEFAASMHMEVWQFGAYMRLLCAQCIAFDEGLPGITLKKAKEHSGLSDYQWQIFTKIFTKYFEKVSPNISEKNGQIFYKNFEYEKEYLRVKQISEKQSARRASGYTGAAANGEKTVHRGAPSVAQNARKNNANDATAVATFFPPPSYVYKRKEEEDTREVTTAVYLPVDVLKAEMPENIEKFKIECTEKFGKDFSEILKDWQTYYCNRFANWATRTAAKHLKSFTSYYNNAAGDWERELYGAKPVAGATGAKADFIIKR